MRIVLASRSPRRRELLAAVGIEAECDPADVAELESHDGTATELAIKNAVLKAEAVADRRADRVVLGADTVVVLDGRIFGKPRDLDHAREMLAHLAGRTHEVITGVCLLRAAGGQRKIFAEVTRVRFRELDAAAIDRYLARIDPLDKAGAYAAQDDDGEIIAEIDGDFDNVVGLPVARVVGEFRKF